MDFATKIRQVSRKFGRYSPDAYHFVFAGLHRTLETVGEHRHVDGRELVGGIVDLARDKFGRMARVVFAEWGVHSSEDFGRIVFHLIEEGMMKKNPSDDLKDFVGVCDFSHELEEKFSFGEDFNL